LEKILEFRTAKVCQIENRESCTKYLGGIAVKDEIMGIHCPSKRVFSFKKSDGGSSQREQAGNYQSLPLHLYLAKTAKVRVDLTIELAPLAPPVNLAMFVIQKRIMVQNLSYKHSPGATTRAAASSCNELI
jgi:hypothetical protein